MFNKSKPDPRDSEILYLRTLVSDLQSQLEKLQKEHSQQLVELSNNFLTTLRPPRVINKPQEASPEFRTPESSFLIRPGIVRSNIPIFGQQEQAPELVAEEQN